MTRLDVARWRLHRQRLGGTTSADPAAVVRHLLAVQAENHSQASWAIATRCAAPNAALFARLYDDGTLLRTHLLRPTWHFVLPDDIGWLLDISRPRLARNWERQLEQDWSRRHRRPSHLFELDESTFWHAYDAPREDTPTSRAHLLQILDEYYRGYQDSRDLLDIAGLKLGGRETSTGMTIIDSQIVGDMKRTIEPDSVTFDIRLLRDPHQRRGSSRARRRRPLRPLPRPQADRRVHLTHTPSRASLTGTRVIVRCR